MKTTKLTLMLLAVLLLTACAQSSRLKSIVESKNADCPYKVEEDLTVNKVELVDKNTVVFYMELSPGIDEVMILDEEDEEYDEIYKEVLSDVLLEWLVESDSPYIDVVNAVIDEEGYIICELQNSKGKTLNCEFSAFRLKKAQEANGETIDSVDSDDDDIDLDDISEEDLDAMDDDTVEEVLKLGIKQADSSMPEDLGDGLTMTSIRLKDTNLVYTVECDEDEVSIETLKQAKKEMKTSMVDMVKEADDDMKFICKALVRTNRGMDYRFVGEVSRESVTIHLTINDIKRALGL